MNILPDKYPIEGIKGYWTNGKWKIIDKLLVTEHVVIPRKIKRKSK